MLFNNFLIICQRSMLLWYQARRVIVLSWTTIQRHKGKISSGLSPPTQFTPMGTLVYHLCQVFNCFGNRTLILQPMALILLEEAKESWQESHMRKTMLALLLPTYCPTLGNHCVHTHAHIHMQASLLGTHAAIMSTGSSDRNKPKFIRK